MNTEMSILIIDDNETVCNFEKYIKKKDGVFLSGHTNNASQALSLVKSLNPNVIILDLELEYGKGNGLTFLDEFNHSDFPYHPFILVTTNNTSQIINSHARVAGADFIMYKYQQDYSPEMVINFILSMKKEILELASSSSIPEIPDQLLQEDSALHIKKIIKEELLRVGISPKVKGFQYLSDAILIYMDDTYCVTHKVATLYGKSEPSVERAMQNAITKAWAAYGTEHFSKHYTAPIRSDKGVPTLLEFIAYYANLIKESP